MSLGLLTDLSSSSERLEKLEQQVAALTAERDQDKQRAQGLHAQLECLRYDARTPREKVDPRQIQLVFESFAQALLTQGVPLLPPPAAGSPDAPEKKKRNVTPHGRRRLPEHLPVETLVLAPAPRPDDAVQLGTEVSWRLGYRRASYYRLRILRPLFVVGKEDAEGCTGAQATHTRSDAPPLTTVPTSAVDAPYPTTTAPTSAAADHATTRTTPTMPAPRGTEAEPAVEIEPAATGDAAASTMRTSWSHDTTTIVYAPAPDEIIARGFALPDTLAHVLVSKFCDHLPFHRQEAISARDGLPITRGTLCGWAEGAHALAKHVVAAAADDAKATANVIATDATGVLVQHPERCKKGHFWVYVADRDHVFFRYTSRPSAEEPTGLFKGYRGTVLSDASNVFDVLYGHPDSPGEANCWSHARRYFYKALDSENKNEALVGIGFCNALFELEREGKNRPLLERLALRKARAGPVLAALERWRDEQMASAEVGEGSRLRKALTYLRNQWAGLCRFLSDAHVSIHNNESERQLRRLVTGRANWLFVGSDESAPITCTFVSLIASAQIHGLDPEAYLRDLFRVLPVWPKNRMLELTAKHWRATRARLDATELAMPLGPITVPSRAREATASP